MNIGITPLAKKMADNNPALADIHLVEAKNCLRGNSVGFQSVISASSISLRVPLKIPVISKDDLTESARPYIPAAEGYGFQPPAQSRYSSPLNRFL